MVKLHELGLGATFEDLVVEVYELAGVDVETKARDPAYTAIIRDETAYARLVYRSSNNCRPSSVKKGKFYRISGKVTSYNGKLQLQIGSSWGRIEKMHGDEVNCLLPFSPASDISSFERLFGGVLVYKEKASQHIKAYIRTDINQSPIAECYATYLDTGRTTAARVLERAFELLPGSFQLLSVAPASHVMHTDSHQVHYICPAILTSTDQFAVGNPAGKWLTLGEIRQSHAKDWTLTFARMMEELTSMEKAGLLDWELAVECPGVVDHSSVDQQEEIEENIANGVNEDEEKDARLPVTLLSGFLGSGKTTLLQHILKNKSDLKCAVIVNDMAELNIDAGLVKGNHLVQAEEKLVEMQNGCICCTLRGDLLEEVASLAKSGRFDYLVIESTGISEPMQVAETFVLPAGEDIGQLADVSRLDTCVTVIDASNLWVNLHSLQTLKEKEGEDNVEDEDDRNVCDLLLDQIEFADVILLNKVDLMSTEKIEQMKGLIQELNPDAEVIITKFSKVDLGKVLNTGKFDFKKAQKAPGWLKAIREGQEIVPETEEYGISSFVYRARRPFHPSRLYDFMQQYFVVQEPDWTEAMGDHDHAHHHCKHHDAEIVVKDANNALKHGHFREVSDKVTEAAEAVAKLLRNCQNTGDSASPAAVAACAAQAAASTAALAAAVAADLANGKSEQGGAKLQSLSENVGDELADSLKDKRALMESSFGSILRSKGFAWLATREDHCVDWSHAGSIMRITTGGPWYCVLPKEAWPTEPDQIADIKKDFEEGIGDRRQEIVVIGIDLKQEAIGSALDSCLCTEQEMKHLSLLQDPFAKWPDIQDILDAGDEEGDEEEDDQEEEQEDDQEDPIDLEDVPDEGNVPSALPWIPGTVYEVFGGGGELQGVLDTLTVELAIVHWHAPWSHACQEAAGCFTSLAHSNHHVAFFHIDVTASGDNEVLAMEKVMCMPLSRRESAHPVLKNGEKFPCFTLHTPPLLHPDRVLSELSSIKELENVIHNTLPPTPPSDIGNGINIHASNDPIDASIDECSMEVLENGAHQLKTILSRAKRGHQHVMVVWTDTDSDDASCVKILQEVRKMLKMWPDVMMIEADVGDSRANEVLATALKVKVYPTAHIYKDMNLVRKLQDVDIRKVEDALNKVLGDSSDSESTTQSSNGHGSLVPVSVFDPPTGKQNRSGAKRRIPGKGVGSYWPKMPCLKCGCPWWLGEDWDAKCARCNWNCERDGYDDDSKPLKKFQKKWEKFVGEIRAGRTPMWPILD